MIGCLQTRVCKQQIITLYFEFETVLKFYNLEAWARSVIFNKEGLAYCFGAYSRQHPRPAASVPCVIM